MHPWHDIYVDDHLIEHEFPVVIEVPMGSKNKYELDKETGLLRLDRVLYGAVHYPANYGFIPRTYCDDGDPLDALVLGQEPVHPLTIVEARAIGVMRMRDEKGLDDKILAVNTMDPAVNGYDDHTQLPAFLTKEINGSFRTTRCWRTSKWSLKTSSARAMPSRFCRRRWLSTDSSGVENCDASDAPASRQNSGWRFPLNCSTLPPRNAPARLNAAPAAFP